jgi:transcriptional repressor NrdR
MFCPRCNHPDTKVYDTRPAKNGKATRRRRECLNCGHRFTTVEEIKAANLKVEKRNGQLIDFSREKLEHGIRKAFNKRAVDTQRVKDLAQKVTDEVMALDKNPVKARRIGKLVLKHLKKVDEAAYICYGAMFWNFDSVEDFNRLVQEFSHE